ncbi:MAG: hypothetical protein ACE5R6_03730 [Candidatus Heimdallarchaeota archaeon]
MVITRRKGIICLVAFGIMLSSIIARGQDKTEFAVMKGCITQWQINGISSGPKVWLGLDLKPKTTWSALNGSSIEFEVTAISSDGDLLGNLVVDELSLDNISVRETGINFALGFYPGIPGILNPWIPGLITDLDFVTHELNARAQAALLNGSFHAEEPVREYLGKKLKVVIFTIVQLGQNATLVYDKKSGILLEADTGFEDFFIKLSISSTTHTLAEATPIPFPGSLVLFSLSFLVLWKRRKLRHH